MNQSPLIHPGLNYHLAITADFKIGDVAEVADQHRRPHAGLILCALPPTPAKETTVAGGDPGFALLILGDAARPAEPGHAEELFFGLQVPALWTIRTAGGQQTAVLIEMGIEEFALLWQLFGSESAVFVASGQLPDFPLGD